MAIITDIQHYLDEDGLLVKLTPEASDFALFLTEIITSVSENYGLPLFFADTECKGIKDGKPCMGEVEVWVFASDNRIGWECVECAETGAISNWEGTRWDKRDYTRH